MKNEKIYLSFLIPKIWQILKHIASSGGAGTRPEPDFFWATRTRFFQVGYVPDPTRIRPYETKHKIWSKKYMIPDKIPDFLATRIRLFGIPTLPDLTRIRLLTIRFIRYPTFCYPLHH